MLDLDDPQSKYIFQAAGRLGEIMELATRMTLVPSPERIVLLHQCRIAVDHLRRLNTDHFNDSDDNAKAIEELEIGLSMIAHLRNSQISEDCSNGIGNCPGCGIPIERIEYARNRFMIYCRQCLNFISPANEKLSFGFGTVWI